MTRETRQRLEDGSELLAFPDFSSGFVRQRTVLVWLPPGYAASANGCRVIYAHDGQNLFDPQTAFAGVDWGLHTAIGRLIADGRIRNTLAVGIWNTPDRYQEYDPQKVVEQYLDEQEQAGYQAEHGRPMADRYLQFIVQELKPFIDSRFRTLPAAVDNLLLGSSMGGIVSVYALCEYPGVFGAAACLSTHWPTGNGKMIDYLADRLPDAQDHRLYFDYGTETVDAQYEPFQRQVDDLLRRRGYVEGRHWITRKFCGADHSERSWRRRIDIPLRFLLR
jgi:predicted alpha/beta superfamily hydrolase